MYGTYWGFSLPLRTLAALVARRPRVWPLASTTYHLRSIFLPLGTKVDISLLPSVKKTRSAYPPEPPDVSNCRAIAQIPLWPRKMRTGFASTHYQTNLFGCGLRGLAPNGLWLAWTRAPETASGIRIQQPVACSGGSPRGIHQPSPGDHTQTPGATPRKDSRILDSLGRVNEKTGDRLQRSHCDRRTAAHCGVLPHSPGLIGFRGVDTTNQVVNRP